MKTLGRVNIVLLTCYIKDKLQSVVKLQNPEMDMSEFRSKTNEILTNFLDDIKQRRSIKNYKVVILDTWTKMYPKLSTRLCAILVYFILIKTNIIKQQTNIIKWYHYVFPFKVKTSTYVDWDDIFDFDDDSLKFLEDYTDYIDEHIKISTTAELISPYDGALYVDLFLDPIPAVEKISINLEINKTSEEDNSNQSCFNRD